MFGKGLGDVLLSVPHWEVPEEAGGCLSGAALYWYTEWQKKAEIQKKYIVGASVMKLQDRDYNIFLREEEKRAYEAEVAYAAI